MGEINCVTCRQCRYHAETREGVGWIGFMNLKKTEKAILNGELQCGEALMRLQNGETLECGAAYLCPVCREFVSSNQLFCRKNVAEEGEDDKYTYAFPFGLPKCETCDAELIFIPNIRSSKVKCPKCGGDLKARLAGFFD